MIVMPFPRPTVHLSPQFWLPRLFGKTIAIGLLGLAMTTTSEANEATPPPLAELPDVTSPPASPLTIPKVSVPEAQKTEASRGLQVGRSCDGKLGVHRTIKVSPKNAFLVGVDNHARLGLRRKELILTFDDGPRVGITDPILDALAAECVKATFFPLGRAARAFPDLLKRVAREGHTIGSHTQSHPLLTKRKNAVIDAEVRRGIASAKAALEGSGYEVSNFFRYPYLGRSKRTDTIVKRYGLVSFHMNIDSWDWKDTTP
ncbi:MAG: polysaccharide deacetylase family protein, partial [Pseudomonadota bacterium]